MEYTTQDGKTMVRLVGKITASNAGDFEDEIESVLAQTKATSLELCAADLSYISSAGLRVVMRLLKRLEKVSIIDASNDVYDVFEMTGLTEIMDVRRALREISLEGCELLGSGANGSVYRTAEDEMVKVFIPTTSLDEIEEERKASRQAFVLGVPCAIPFDTVRCGDSYGTVYEALKAKTLSECIEDDPTTLGHYAVSSARLLRHLHDIEVSLGALPPADYWYHMRLDSIAADFLEDEMALMHELLHAIPSSNRFVHNDYHTKNVMDADGELMIIDLGGAGAGNPILDIMHTYLVFNMMGTGTGERSADKKSFIGLTYGQLEEFWTEFIGIYCGDGNRVEQINALLKPWGLFMYLFTSMSHPRLPQQYHAPYANRMRSEVLSRAEEMRAGLDELQSLCGIG